MTAPHQIYLECGTQWVFACAVDWPGWCRRAKGEDAAIEELLAYVPRYRAVVGRRFTGKEVEVIGRVEGSVVTDFGAPNAIGPTDHEALGTGEIERLTSLVESCWKGFDKVVANAPEKLRKGPRGGGRDTEKIVEHVRNAERSYARKAGAEVPPRTPWPEQREAIAAALRSYDANSKWPPRYSTRRVAWHVLDHAWEIEDKSE
jgi:hypothetical protein